MVEVPKKQVVVDRLRRRIENYRKRQTDCLPRYDQSFNGVVEQNLQETLVLKQKFLETKAKRAAKKSDKKTDVNSGSAGGMAGMGQHNLHNSQQKYLKRNSEELQDAGPGGAGAGDFEPPPKMQCTSGPPGPQQQQQQQTGGPQRAGNNNNQQQQQQQQQGGGQNSGGNEGLTKFSVEIVQQLEFTTSAANSQPQQISTNVTVKALTNTSVKSDVSSSASPAAAGNERGPTPKSNPPTPASSVATPGSTQSSAAPSSQQQGRPNAAACVDLGSLVECKQEPGESEFVDLEQCAAALEKDAAAAFPGFSDLIGDDTNDEIITSDAFKDLISEISDFHPEFMKDLGFEEKPVLLNDHQQQRDQHHHDSSTDSSSITASMGGMLEHSNKLGVHSPGNIGQQQFSPQPVYGDNMNKQGPRIQAYSGLDFKSELRPAAQTLKQMAEQHQHKTQLGMSFGPAAAAAAVAVAAAGGNAGGGGARNVRSPYGEFFPTGNEASFMHSPTSGPPPPYLSKQQAGFGPDLVGMQQCGNAGFTMEQKRQMAAMQQQQQQQQQAKMNFGPTKQTPQQSTTQQPFSPYGSPNHGSPQYMARGQQPGPQPTPQQQQQPPPPFGGSTPPHRPPSLPPAASLHISQAQQMHVTQQSGPNQMQVTAGQHMQMTTDLKGSSGSLSSQQAMFYQQQQQQQSAPGAPPSQATPSQPQDSATNSYNLSQSQTINFTQQTLRQRAPRPQQAPAPEQQPTPVPQGRPSALDIQQHKLLQQQQMMRTQLLQQQQAQQAQQQAQQQQQQHQQQQQGIPPRGPPPEYKHPQHMMHQQRFQIKLEPSAIHSTDNSSAVMLDENYMDSARQQAMRQQAMPPSGPMMRAQGPMMAGPQGYQQAAPQQMNMGPRSAYAMSRMHRPPNVSIGPDGLNIGGRVGAGPAAGSPEWRHMMMSQQQSMVFNQQMGGGGMAHPQQQAPPHQQQSQPQTQMRPGAFNSQTGSYGGMVGGAPGSIQHQMAQLQQQQQQQQLMRQQQQQQGGMGPGGMGAPVMMNQGHGPGGGMGGGGMPHQGNPGMAQPNGQISMSMQMSQSMSMSANGQPSHQHHHQQSQPGHHQHHQQQVSSPHLQPSQFGSSAPSTPATPPAPPDFSLEFLDSLPSGDPSQFSAAAQELLSSLDPSSGFLLDGL